MQQVAAKFSFAGGGEVAYTKVNLLQTQSSNKNLLTLQ